MKLFFSVGEPSGDLHGANLIRELRRREPDVRCVGFGGPRMAEAGCELHADLTRLAIMWFARVLLNLHRFWLLLRQADRYFREERPDAVILIDYPGFNWWIARRAKARRIPVFYYGAPQMWAWAPWRVRKMRRLVDHVLCKLPFEADWYNERGCRALYVGHPYFDELLNQHLDQHFLAEIAAPDTPLVTLLPGSRKQEVTANLDDFLRVVRRLRALLPETRFAMAAYNEEQAEMAKLVVDEEQLPVKIHVGRTPELIHAASVCLACSGSVSLELLYHMRPSVIHYRVSRFAFRVQKYFRTVRFITLVNLLASENRFCQRGELYDPAVDDVPFPEYLTCEDRSVTISNQIERWLQDPEAHAAVVRQLASLRSQLAQGGASKRAADYIVTQLTETAGRSSVESSARAA
jgi:lipid-A-disaccharide synthase